MKTHQLSSPAKAQTVAIVGESGCGKSTFAKVVMGLETATDGLRRVPTALDIAQLSGVQKRLGGARSARLQMVFQNPFDTLNPSHSVGSSNQPA